MGLWSALFGSGKKEKAPTDSGKADSEARRAQMMERRALERQEQAKLPDPPEGWVDAEVKKLVNKHNLQFAFLTVHGHKDIHVGHDLLNSCGIALAKGTKVQARWKQTPKGPDATELRSV